MSISDISIEMQLKENGISPVAYPGTLSGPSKFSKYDISL